MNGRDRNLPPKHPERVSRVSARSGAGWNCLHAFHRDLLPSYRSCSLSFTLTFTTLTLPRSWTEVQQTDPMSAMTFAPRRPYILLAPAALDLLLLTQPGPTYLRLLCLARASVLIGLTFAARWRKRTLALVVPLASVLACVWETCKSTLYKYPSAPGDGDGDGSGGGKGDWDEWYGPEASATYLAEVS